MNLYNLTVILDGKTTAAKKKAALEKLSSLITTFEGKLGEINDMGERELAYEINKNTTGVYLNLPLTMKGESAKKLMDKVRLEDYVLRYLLVRKDEKIIEAPKAEQKTAKKTKTSKEVSEEK